MSLSQFVTQHCQYHTVTQSHATRKDSRRFQKEYYYIVYYTYVNLKADIVKIADDGLYFIFPFILFLFLFFFILFWSFYFFSFISRHKQRRGHVISWSQQSYAHVIQRKAQKILEQDKVIQYSNSILVLQIKHGLQGRLKLAQHGPSLKDI